MSRLSRCLTFFTTFFALIHPGYGATFQGLGDLGGRDFDSRAYAISADGSVVVGRSSSASTMSTEAFRWTSDGGIVGLGFLEGAGFDSRAYAISADGSVVVGESFSSSASGSTSPRCSSPGASMEGGAGSEERLRDVVPRLPFPPRPALMGHRRRGPGGVGVAK